MKQAEQGSTTRGLAISIRATRRQRDLIDQAAHALGRSRSDFMLETACREAEHILLDHRYVQLDPEAFEQFSALLDRPPPPTDKLRRLLLQPAPWE